jgi:hypothetical protein
VTGTACWGFLWAMVALGEQEVVSPRCCYEWSC